MGVRFHAASTQVVVRVMGRNCAGQRISTRSGMWLQQKPARRPIRHVDASGHTLKVPLY